MIPIIDVFEGGKKKTVYFHVMFYSTYLISWMRKLLDSSEAINVHNAVIVMDNSKYYKSIPKNTPKASWKNQQLVDYCLNKGLDLEENDLKTVIWVRINSILGTMSSLWLSLLEMWLLLGQTKKKLIPIWRQEEKESNLDWRQKDTGQNTTWRERKIVQKMSPQRGD